MHRQHILIPVDAHGGSADALSFVRGRSAEAPVDVRLLHVVNLNLAAVERRVYEVLCREGETELRMLAGRFFADGETPRFKVRIGNPCEEIVAEAHAEPTDLIILAAPKPSRWRRLLGPHTVEWVVRNAPCPTLVLPRTGAASPASDCPVASGDHGEAEFAFTLHPASAF